jgi:hypothetical protein
MRSNDVLVINEVAKEMYDNAADHGFHNPGGGGLDEDAIFLMALHGEISSHWEKLRRGEPVSPLDNRIFDRARTRVGQTTLKIDKRHPIRPGGEEVDVGRMARFIVNLIGEASELWEATRLDELDNPCDKKGCPLTCEGEEMADLSIRLMDMAVARRIDLGGAIQIKAQYNEGRPHMHGKKA